MKAGILGICLTLLLCLLSAESASPFGSNPNKINPNNPSDQRQRDYFSESATKPVGDGGYFGGHDTITAEAVNLKRQVHNGDGDFSRWADQALPGFRTGVHDEDATLPGDERIGPNSFAGGWLTHFYSPGFFGLGLFWGAFQNAKEKAKREINEAKKYVCYRHWSFDDFSSMQKQKIYDHFGRAMHLVQDMCVPSHVKSDKVIGDYLHGVFGPGGFGNSVFEKHVQNNWAQIVTSQGFMEKVTTDKYVNGSYGVPRDLDVSATMESAAAEAKEQPGDLDLYEQKPYVPGQPTPEFVLDEERLRDTAEAQAAEAVLRTAGLVDAIYEGVKSGFQCDNEVPPRLPGGGHPDESFDLSTWEEKNTQSGMSEYDLLGFFMSVGLKKGNLSSFYARRLMELFGEVRAMPDDPSQQAKDAVDSRFRHLVDGIQTQNGIPDQSPDVALLQTGFHAEMMGLINKHQEPVRVIDVNFSPDIVRDHPVLIVPSGGLSGMDKSSFFKLALAHYVKSGGTLIVFAQQQGAEFSTLPVPEEPDGTYRQVEGYGWNQDQNCFTDAVFINTWHQMLSGQSRSTPTFSVDGYFTRYPSDTAVLLTRTANGQPAMIMYGYGAGRVIATTLYSDYAFAHSQASQEEMSLVRDIVAWAKAQIDLPETQRSGSVNVPLPIVNRLDRDAASVRIVISSPDRSVAVSEQVVTSALPAGASTVISVLYVAPPAAPLGIYHADYVLLDASGDVLQPRTETDSGRFAVAKPPKTGTPDKAIRFSVTSPSQDVLFGRPMEYTFHVFNNTPETRNLTIRTDLWHTSRSRPFSITAAPMSETTLSASDPFTDEHYMFETLHSYLYDESGRYLASYDLSFSGTYATPGLSISGLKHIYGKGETMAIQATVANRTRFDLPFTVTIDLYQSPGQPLLSTDEKIINAAGYSKGIVDFAIPLLSDYPAGSYQCDVFVSNEGQVLTWSHSRFEISESQISSAPNLPAGLAAGMNEVSFSLANKGRVPVSAGLIAVTLKDPDGQTVYTESTSFTLALEESKTVNVPLPVPALKYGNYQLTYSLSDETRTGPTVDLMLPSNAAVSIAQDRPSYRVRETAGISVDLSNTGKFNFDGVQLTLAIPGCGFVQTKSIALGSNQSTSVSFPVPVGEEVSAGAHAVQVTAVLPSGDAIGANSILLIPEASLRMHSTGPASVKPGEAIPIIVENTGGVDAYFFSRRMALVDPAGIELWDGEVSGVIEAGTSQDLVQVVIPDQAAKTDASLSLALQDGNTGRFFETYLKITIDGLTAEESTVTDRENYLSTDDVVAISRLANGPYQMTGGSLSLTVSGTPEASGGFVRVAPKSGWAPFYDPSAILRDEAGFFYVIDECESGETCVKKFDSNLNLVSFWETGVSRSAYGAVGQDGTFYLAGEYAVYLYTTDGIPIGQFGSEGTGDGQLLYPSGIALAPDRSIYVVDRMNSRVQKFDRNGNFILKWGSPGNGEGQFRYPAAVAMDRDGFVYVVDRDDSCVQKFDSNGNFVTRWGSWGSGPGQLNSPVGIVTGPDNSLYVADGNNHRVQRFAEDGRFLGTFGNEDTWMVRGVSVDAQESVYLLDYDMGGRIQKFSKEGILLSETQTDSVKDGQFYRPHGIAVGPEGWVYVTDAGWEDRVQKLDRHGNFLMKWGEYGDDEVGISFPGGIAVSADGFVYVAEKENNRIQKFDLNGNHLTKWGQSGTGDGQFDGPWGVAVGPDGAVYVTEQRWAYARIQKFDPDGNFISKWGEEGTGDYQFSFPAGIAVDRDGFVYVADSGNNRIQKFDGNGNLITRWGSYGTEDGQFNDPQGIAVGPDGSIYVTEGYGNRVQRFDPDGAFITKWGQAGFTDGSFKWPMAVAVDREGSVYVTDTRNGRIQKLGSSKEEAVVFHTAVPVNQTPGGVGQITADMGKVSATGKLRLSSVLTNSLGQKIAESTYPFYVAKENFVIALSTDKAFYRSGEAVTLTGEIRNLSTVSATGVSMSIDRQEGTAEAENLIYFVCDVPAGGVSPFTLTTRTEADGSYGLTATAKQNGKTVAETNDRYEVSTPKIRATVEAPEIVGDDPFEIVLRLANMTRVDAQVTVTASMDGRNQPVTVPAGRTVTVTYSDLRITEDGEYTFVIGGDESRTVSRLVRYGLSVALAATPALLYGEGRLVVPVNVSNTGPLDARFTVEIALDPGDTIQKTYFIPHSVTVDDVIVFDLIEGNYALSLTSRSPSATWSSPIIVRKEINASLSPLDVTSRSGSITVMTEALNSGSRPLEGTIRMSVTDANDGIVWQASRQMSLQSGQNPDATSAAFSFSQSSLAAGNYTVGVDLLDEGGRSVSRQAGIVTVRDGHLQITSLPSFQTVRPGEEATFIFRVTNDGGKAGAAELRLRSHDFIDLTRREWIPAGETREFPFAFSVPADLEEKDYVVQYELTGDGVPVTRGLIPYHVNGIALTVEAGLDKSAYRDGETARLALTVSSPSSRDLFIRISYGTHEEKLNFTLSGTQSFVFDVPLGTIGTEKLFYGVYGPEGRSIHLNSLYVRKTADVLTITTNKQLYNEGETVLVSASGAAGTLTLSGPGYEETFPFPGTAARSFVLPAPAVAGTYYVEGRLILPGETADVQTAFDVSGLQVKVYETSLDKSKYASSDAIRQAMCIEANRNIVAVLKVWIIDPGNNTVLIGDETLPIAPGQSVLDRQYPLSTTLSGLHRLVYGFYWNGVLLASGGLAFDVGEAAILALTPDKLNYASGTEPVMMRVDLLGTEGGTLSLLVNGAEEVAQQVHPTGFHTIHKPLTLQPGVHRITASLSAGGLLSSKEAIVAYGTKMADLVPAIFRGAVDQDGVMRLTVSTVNRGGTDAGATTLHLYDGASLLFVLDVGPLPPGGRQAGEFPWNVIGKAGQHMLRAVVDAEGVVAEYNKNNNEASASMIVPDGAIISETDKDSYAAGETVTITTKVLNLTAATTSTFTLVTAIDDQRGIRIHEQSRQIAVPGQASTTISGSWMAQSGGNYVLTQRLLSGAIAVGEQSKRILVAEAIDFSAAIDSGSLRTKQGEQAIATVRVQPFSGWTYPVTFSVSGLPASASSSFDAATVVPPGSSVLTVAAGETPPGTYDFIISARGPDGENAVIHTLPVSLDIAAFAIESTPCDATVRQQEATGFMVRVISVNGYSGNVTFKQEVANIRGLSISLDKQDGPVPCEVYLRVVTSKYAVPGVYAIPLSVTDGLVTKEASLLLTVTENPTIAPGFITTAPAAYENQATVSLFNRSFSPVLQFRAFPTRFGANAVMGDLDGDGEDEIVVAPGPDPFADGRVRVYRQDGTFLVEQKVFNTRFGATLAIGDIDGDWKEELVVGTGPGPLALSRLKVLSFSGNGFIDTGIDFIAFPPSYRSGVNLALGDVDGDGTLEIVTGAGPGLLNRAAVRVFKIDISQGIGRWSVASVLSDFLVGFGDGLDCCFGVHVAAGDINGDDIAEIVASPGPSPLKRPMVKAFRGDGTPAGTSFQAYSREYALGVYVAARDLDGDGVDEIVTGPGPWIANESWVRVFKGDGTPLSDGFVAYPQKNRHGVKVSTGNIGE